MLRNTSGIFPSREVIDGKYVESPRAGLTSPLGGKKCQLERQSDTAHGFPLLRLLLLLSYT